MDTPTHMPGDAPAMEPPVITYLRDSTTGREFGWTEELAERDNMVALDQYKRIVPNAPITSAGQAPVPFADPDPMVSGMASKAQIQHLQAQIDTLREQLSALHNQVTTAGG